MHCKCSQYQPIAPNRKSINKRIKETKEIKKGLVLLAENKSREVELYRCPVCGQLWQSGHDWKKGYQEYLFQVPEIDVAKWKAKSYVEPAALMLYMVMMENYLEQNTVEASSNPCRAQGCKERAIKMSVFCEKHHIKQLQKVGLLPERPKGRRFPPYTY